MFLVIPSRLLSKMNVNNTHRAAVNILFSNLVIVLFVVGVLKAVPAQLKTCLFKKYAGIPCPGCGITRGLGELLRLNVQASFQYNPCALIMGAGIIISLVLAVIHFCSNGKVTNETLLKFIIKSEKFFAWSLLVNYLFTLLKPNSLCL